MNIGTITIQQSMVYCVAMKKRVGKNKLRLSGPSSPKRKNDLNKSDAQKAERIKTKIRKREKQNRTAESERCRENAKAPSLVRKTVNLVPKLRPSLPPRSKLLAELEALHDKDGIIANTEQFDCIICMSTIEIGDGVVLRDCLHQFCVDCIKNSIVYSNDAEIPCPYGNGKIRCDGIILDHEVRALVSADVYETYLNRSLRIAEATIPNTVHCKKVNCVIWCICEDNVKRFDCPNCQSQNCVPCQVITNSINGRRQKFIPCFCLHLHFRPFTKVSTAKSIKTTSRKMDTFNALCSVWKK